MSNTFSICIPNFNYEQYIGIAINSTLKQGYYNLELLNANNLSTDNSINIVGDLFQIEADQNTFTYELFEDEKNNQLARYFDTCLVNNGYNLQEIKLIEGLLFLSMIPYHADYFERQQMMYIKCIMILNEL